MDLNRIEHVWDILQAKITLQMGNFQNAFSFRGVLREKWTNLSQTDNYRIILKMNCQFITVINQCGGYILNQTLFFPC